MCTFERNCARSGCELTQVGTIATRNPGEKPLNACMHCLTIEGCPVKLPDLPSWAEKHGAVVHLNATGSALIAPRN